MMAGAGYYSGAVTGDFDRDTKTALETLVGTENCEERVDFERFTMDPPVLQYLRNKFGSKGG